MPSAILFPITTSDGLTLQGRRWPVASADLRARAVLIHGVGEHAARYEHVAHAMNEVGVEVVGFDQRGFGASEGQKGVIPASDTLVEDARMVFGLIEAEPGTGGTPPFLIAHSMGGTIAAFAVATGRIRPRGLMLSSPAVKPRIPGISRLLLRTLLPIAPNVPLKSGIKARDLTHDPAVIEAITHDRLMHTTVTPRLIAAILDQGQAALEAAGSVAIPTLVQVARDDRVVHADAGEAFAHAIAASLVTLHSYPGLFHEIFNESEPARTTVLNDLRTWLRSRV